MNKEEKKELKIEAIIINKVKYNKVQATTNLVCEECDLSDFCSNSSFFSILCQYEVEPNNTWKKDDKNS